MERMIVDCGTMAAKEDFHTALAQVLNFPDWYGGNLDALHDLLTAISEATALQLHGWQNLKAALGPYGPRLEKVLAVSALENPQLTIEFC